MNIEELRAYLLDYYGTAVFSGMPMALIDVSKVKNASAEELIKIAEKEHIDLSKFIK
ncbi:MAG: hypothetical protein IKE28_06025 [Solobacterium sp.]|nr:hypothetical protein [Solobacterium sp.]